ncbi:Sec-independent protein translocase protein TatB [Persephonella sp.]
MFGIGFTELIVIFIVALLVLGPKRLPEVAKTLGKFYREIRSTVEEVKSTVVDDTVRSLPKEEDIVPKNLSEISKKDNWEKEFEEEIKKEDYQPKREKISFKNKNKEEKLNDRGNKET